MKRDEQISGRVFLSVTSYREAEVSADVAGLVCRVTKRKLSCHYRGDETAMAAWRLPLRNMMNFAGDKLDIPSSDLADAIRRDARACQRHVRDMAQRLKIGWQFREGADLEPAGPQDIVVLPRDDHRVTSADIRKALKAARSVLVPAGRAGTAAPGPVVLLATAQASSATQEVAGQLAQAMGREPVSLQPGSASLLQQMHPSAIVLDAADVDGIDNDVLDSLLALRCALLVAGSEA